MTRDGRLIATKNPAGHEAAWWLAARDIGSVPKRAREDHDEIPAAAAALGVRTVEHSAIMQRTEALVAKLNSRLRTAQRNGDVGFFNREYRRRRIEARERGEGFMSYTAAKARLRRALVEVAAGKAPALVARVFDGDTR